MNLIDQLNEIQSDLGHLHSEIVLCIGAMAILGLGLIKAPHWIVKGTFYALVALVLFGWSPGTERLFSGMILETPLTNPIGRIILFGTILMIFFRNREWHNCTYYFLLLIVLLGCIVSMKANHLLLLYLGIETISYGCYVLTGFVHNRSGYEAGIKYLIFGGVSSAIMIYGISLVYGASGTLSIEVMQESHLYQIGWIFVFCGLFFKVALVPFHLWVPNTYQAGAIDFVAFLSVVPKLAILVVIGRLIDQVSWAYEFVMGIGVFTVLIGSFGSLVQKNVRRLIAYGAIAQTGFLLPLVILGGAEDAFVWYASVYVLMTFGAFYLVSEYESRQVFVLEDYKGIGKKNLFLAIISGLIFLSLIGLPPLAGFTAKWFLFSSLWETYQLSHNTLTITYLVVAVLMTVISFYFYFRISYVQFFSEADRTVEISPKSTIFVAFVSIILILLFVAPNLLSPLLFRNCLKNMFIYQVLFELFGQ